jgi:hypothetical protein
MIEEAVFLKYAQVRPMKSHTDNIDKITITGRVTKHMAAGAAVPVADRVNPTVSQVQLVAQPYKSEVRLNDDVLEDNIEQKRLAATVQERMAKAIARDMEEIAIEGNTSSSDLFLKSQNGLLALITSHTVDAGGDAIAMADFKAAIKALPDKYKKERSKLRWFTSHTVDEDFRNDVSTRATALGDGALFKHIPMTPLGVPLYPCSMFPEDISTNKTACVLMDPKNFILGMWRDIKLETGRDVSAGETIFTYSYRAGMNLEEEDATVEIHNILVA